MKSANSAIRGLTDPFTGGQPVGRVYAYGHTFRWVRGDRYVAVQRGTCVDTKRVLVIRDTLAGHVILDGYQPLVDAVPVDAADWHDAAVLRRLADAWAANHRARGGRRAV